MDQTEKIEKNDKAEKTEKTDQTLEPRQRRGSVLWHGMNRFTARLYAILVSSFLGRIMTGYRRLDGKLRGRTHNAGPYRSAPVSPARLRLVETMESSWLIRGLRALVGALLDCPTVCYGLFGMIFGLLGVLFYFLGPYMSKNLAHQMSYLILSAVIALASLPLLLSKRRFAETLGNSPILRRFLIRFLGIPRDILEDSSRGLTPVSSVVAVYLSCVLGIGAGISTLFISPLVIPLVLLALALLFMIFSYPETGVVLFTLMLPLVWLDQRFLAVVVGLILLTWCSYGIKLLFLHRTLRFGLLDRVILVLGLLIFATGFTGYGVNAETIWQSICLTVFLSSYFLIVNLMTTRQYVRRCLLGVAASVVVVTALAYIRHIPLDSLLWLEGSRAGDAIISGAQNAVERLSQLWLDHSELYLVLAFSWLYAYLIHTKRLFRKIMGGLFILLALILIIMTSSVSALFCIVVMTVLFLLMLGHKWLSAGLFILPTAVCAIGWVQYLYPVSDTLLTVLSRSRLYKAQLTESLWRMVMDHPAGIGVGNTAFAAVYPSYAAPDLGAVSDSGNLFFEIVLSFGWVGGILAVAILFLFLQKSFTCLRYTAVSKDRAMILGGVSSLLSMVIFGSVRSFITSPRVFFTIMLVVALCSVYENIVFEESDMARAERESSERAEDRFYRSGEFKHIRTNASTSQKE